MLSAAATGVSSWLSIRSRARARKWPRKYRLSIRAQKKTRLVKGAEIEPSLIARSDHKDNE
jgi:hypothetical protein